MNDNTQNTVAVALSGGVDSSVAAALLKQQGCDVVGVTMHLFSTATGVETDQAVQDARRVAAALDIPHHVVDLSPQFERTVVDYFAAEYAHGRTPNPCVVCNQSIKFGALLQWATSHGAGYLVTGHYARVSWDGERRRFLLLRPRDSSKDQTYALYRLSQDQLAHVLFPLGELTKTEVRHLAHELGLPVSQKPESQDICFVPDGDYAAFLRHRIPGSFTPGPIRDVHGNLLGEHSGLAGYTHGQRRGLGLTAPERLYVVDIQPESNTLVVGTAGETRSRGLVAGNLNLISLPLLPQKKRVEAKIRYNSRALPAVVESQPENRAVVVFDSPPRAVTPGQSVVFYTGDEVLGGGVIERPLA